MEGQNQSDEHFAAKIDADKQKSASDTYNVGCVGQIALGQDPLTPEDAKRQVQEVLARVKARIAAASPPVERIDVIDASPLPAKQSTPMSCDLADL
jgi:hypothetical protein